MPSMLSVWFFSNPNSKKKGMSYPDEAFEAGWVGPTKKGMGER